MAEKTTLKIFIASSAEVKDERDRAVLELTRLNNAHSDFHIEPVKWEYAMIRGSFFENENIQAAITPKLKESELAVFIFFSRLGVYTLEEFECAKKENKKTFIFFKKGFSPNNKEEHEAYGKLIDFKFSLNHTVLTIDYSDLTDFANELYVNINLYLSEKIKSKSNHSFENIPHHCIELNNIPNLNLIEFVGREKELEDLHEKIMQSNRVVLMNGIGGVGKTTLAKKYLQEHKHEYNYAAFVEIKIQDDNTDNDKIIPACKDAFANDTVLASNLQLQFAATVTNEERFEGIINKLRNLTGKGLLVLDNMPLLPAGDNFIEILPTPPGWTVLVTSRNIIEGFDKFHLDTLSLEEARILFTTFYTGSCTGAEIDELLSEIGYHTLTTELLAKTLQNTDGMMNIGMLTQKIKSRKLDDESLQEKINTSHHNKGETTVYLHLSQALSMANLSDEEKWIMKNFAFLMSVNYTAARLIEWLQVEEDKHRKFRKNLRSLLQKGWLQQKEENSYTMHRMLQQLVQYQLLPIYEDIEMLVDTLQRKLNSNMTTDYRIIFHTLPYAEYFLQALNIKIYEHDNTLTLLNNLGGAYNRKGEYDKAIGYYEKALKMGVKYHGEQHPKIGIHYNNIGFAYFNKGECDKAIEYYEKALNIDLEHHGGDHPHIARDYNNLGAAYDTMKEYNKAIDYYEKALKISLKHYGEDDPKIAICYNNLGVAYDHKGEYDKAIEYCKRGLKIDLKYYSDEHPDIAFDYNNLGSAYDTMKEYNKAIDYYEKSLLILKKFLPENHPSIQTVQDNLNVVKKKLNN